jgi:radical SAM superfamily enzyme YgiQ (UPF0313 family)
LKKQPLPGKLDCLLVHVPKFGNYYRPFGNFPFINLIPSGMFPMADLLQREGHATRILHLGLELETNGKFSLFDFICRTDPRLVALDLHYHQQAYDVIEVAELIKEHFPGKFVLLGGLTASFYPEEILRKFSGIDAVIWGDGEVPLLLLMRLMKARKEDLSPVPNLVWRNEGLITRNQQIYTATAEDMNRLDYANFSLLQNSEQYISSMKMHPFSPDKFPTGKKGNKGRSVPISVFYLQTGKGCPFSCSWCGGGKESHLATSGRNEPVFRSHESVIGTLRKAHGSGFNSFHVSFDPEPSNPAYYLGLFERLREENLCLGCIFESWGLPTREFINSFAATFPLEKSLLLLTLESGSERERKLNRANYASNQEFFETLSSVEEAKIPTEVYFTLASGTETEKDAETTSAFMLNLKRNFRCVRAVRAFTVEIEPGSPLQKDPGKFEAVSNRRNFMDYYVAGSWDESNPYAALGYHLPGYFKDRSRCDDLKTFEGEMQALRCRSFCILRGDASPLEGRIKCWFKSLTGGRRCSFNFRRTFFRDGSRGAHRRAR